MERRFVGRAGGKLEFALKTFKTDVSGLVCADFGSSTGGFTDCLLQHGAKKVYAVETGYGLLDWKLRNDARVVVLEKTNAVHVELPEKVALITIDTGWTKQSAILPSAYNNLIDTGRVISLVKLSFEAGRENPSDIQALLQKVGADVIHSGFTVVDSVRSPIPGAKGKNIEYLFCLQKRTL